MRGLRHIKGARAFQPSSAPRRRARANLLALFGFVGLAALVPITRASLSDIALQPPLLRADLLLCPLTGLAAWLVWRRIDIGMERKRAALRRWGWFLMLAALWPALLYAARSQALAVLALLLCLAVACWTARSFQQLRPAAALAILPYVAWIAAMATIVATGF